ncbi:MAG: DRTGG domain-containing protein [Dehalococcoidia bacterium]
MSILYVVSDNAGAGKTALCASLASVLNDIGRKVTVSKPIFADDEKSDHDNYSAVLDSSLSSSSNESIDLNNAAEKIKSMESGVDTLLLEASNSLSVDQHVELVKAIEAKVIHVSKYNRSIDSIPFITAFGDNLIGTVINFLTIYKGTEAYESVIPRLEESGINVLGLIPEDRTLLSLTVKQICENLEGIFFAGEEYGEDLVEGYMVGGFGMDPGEYIFSKQDKKAVVVRGDRPDVQMSALETNMECFIMTGGLEPIEYVKYEAEEEEVSIIIVNSDTLETMDKIGSLQKYAEFDHKEKLSKFKDLISKHVDVEGLKAAF